MPALQSHEFEGCRFAYRVDGAGPPLVMIQGVGAQGSVLNPQIERLSKHYTCLSFDNRGIGASQPAAREITAPQMAADVLALMDHLGWNSAHLIGHSFGGQVSIQLALDAPARVRSLSLLCSFANGERAVRLSAKLLWILIRIRFAPPRIRRKAFMEIVLPPGDPRAASEGLAAYISKILGHDIAEMPAIGNRQIHAMKHTDLTLRLPEIAGIPVLIVNAAKDMIARPELGRILAAGIAGARYVEIPGAAHAFPILEPDRCAELLGEHLEKAESQWSAR
jgi:pimeloyl-ACP methyl ester carboxylesterase